MHDPIVRFAEWLAEAEAIEPNDPNACALATAGSDGWPDVRMVLAKHVDARGFVFYTNLQSSKGRQLATNARAAMCFHWKRLQRQVRVQGPVAPVPPAEADAYFATRPRESQLSAWASQQSEPLDSRHSFEARLAETGARFPRAIPRPPFWSGFRLEPLKIEFWEDRRGRQHHRERYLREGDGWRIGLLYP